MADSAEMLAHAKDPAGARPVSQGAALGALAQAQLSGATRLVSDAATVAVERFSDPAFLASGKVNVISLETIQQRFGDRWPSRKSQVFTFVERLLARSLGRRGVFVRASDMDYLVVHSELGRLASQAACLCYLREILSNFVGDDQDAPIGIRQVTQITHGRLQTCEIDAVEAEASLSAGAHDGDPAQATAFSEESDLAPRAVNQWTPFVAIDGRRLRVSATLEPVYELKGFTRIGFRMIRRVITIATAEELSAPQVTALSAGDILRADLATITRGIDRLRLEAQGERQLSLVVPVSFTSLSSQRGRTELIAPLKEAGSLVRLGVICEILDIEGVPPGALQAATALVRPFSLLVAGRLNGGSLGAMERLRGAGLQALSFECPQNLGEAEFLSWATATIAAAKRVAKSVVVYRVASSERAAALASLGATHVSLAAPTQ